MPVRFRPEGVWTALVTPFDRKGKLDSATLKRMIEFQVAQGVTGVVPAGTTGESPTLSWDEHNRLVEETIVFAKERVGVLAGAGSNCTDEAIDATRHAREAGASAALLVDCYYNGPSSLELRTEYYEQVAAWVKDLPVVPYLIPGRTGTVLSAEDMAILHRAQPQRFPAVKQATGDLARMRQDRALAGDSLAILSGDDDLTLAMMEDPAIRAAGVVSVMSNIVPGPLCKMVQAHRAGDGATAKAWAAKLEPLFKLVVCKAPGSRVVDGAPRSVEDRFRNPVPVKTMMVGLGMPVGLCRRPLGKMTRAGVDRCREALQTVYRNSPELLAPVAQAFGVKLEQRLADDTIWAELTRG
ncbi:MAG: 4-hydroxy-tetrahydrodipicolinate synthase [Planctomycetota bacterium]|nr:4-hydroxy-tetrahydrodipicolinate synthase [Planctomycetota bacterium]